MKQIFLLEVDFPIKRRLLKTLTNHRHAVNMGLYHKELALQFTFCSMHRSL